MFGENDSSSRQDQGGQLCTSAGWASKGAGGHKRAEKERAVTGDKQWEAGGAVSTASQLIYLQTGAGTEAL